MIHVIVALLFLVSAYCLVAVFVCLDRNDDALHPWCPLCLIGRLALAWARWRNLC